MQCLMLWRGGSNVVPTSWQCGKAMLSQRGKLTSAQLSFSTMSERCDNVVITSLCHLGFKSFVSLVCKSFVSTRCKIQSYQYSLLEWKLYSSNLFQTENAVSLRIILKELELHKLFWRLSFNFSKILLESGS